VSTKFVQIKALGFQLAPLRGLYTGERLQDHHGPLVHYISPSNALFFKFPFDIKKYYYCITKTTYFAEKLQSKLSAHFKLKSPEAKILQAY
jgi:hypothetical protein